MPTSTPSSWFKDKLIEPAKRLMKIEKKKRSRENEHDQDNDGLKPKNKEQMTEKRTEPEPEGGLTKHSHGVPIDVRALCTSLQEKRTTRAQSCLQEVQYDNLPEFMAQGVFTCKVVRVYDGDTVWVAIYCSDSDTENELLSSVEDDGNGHTKEETSPSSRKCVWRVCCRLLHIDAPEMPRSHAEAMSDYYVRGYNARDRLVELVTDCSWEGVDRSNVKDTSGNRLPSLSDTELQKLVDKNTAVIVRGLTLDHGMDKYGRYLATLRTRDGRDAASVLKEEGHGVSYEGGARAPVPQSSS